MQTNRSQMKDVVLAGGGLFAGRLDAQGIASALAADRLPLLGRRCWHLNLDRLVIAQARNSRSKRLLALEALLLLSVDQFDHAVGIFGRTVLEAIIHALIMRLGVHFLCRWPEAEACCQNR